MKDMTYDERLEYMEDSISGWGNCYGCKPLEKPLIGFEIFGSKAIFKLEDVNMYFALYSEEGKKIAEYKLNLETGMAVMISDTSIICPEYTSYRGMVADITAPWFNDYDGNGVFALVNAPVVIDTTVEEIKPMSIDEICHDIVEKLLSNDEDE